MSEKPELAAAAAEAKPGQNGKPRHYDETPRELAGFYEDLGRFNATIIARAIEDPTSIGPLRKTLGGVFCPEHDASCDSGYKYDHLRNVCIKGQDTEM